MAYDSLKRLAAAHFRNEAAGHTLQPTALVHEVFLKLAKGFEAGPRISPSDERHYMALAARAMRQILVDHARARNAAKRGGEHTRVSLADADGSSVGTAVDVIDLHEALDRFAAIDERAARVIELRFFAGLSIQQTADVLGISDWTVESDWRAGRAWLAARLSL